MEHIVWFIILSLIAEIIGTIGGFGSSLLFVPIAGYFLDFHSVLGITALFHLASNVSKIALFRKGFDKKLIIQMGIPSVFFVAVGAYFSQFLESKLLEIVLAAFLMIISVFLYVNKTFSLKPTTSNSVAGGAISGLCAGLLGTGGAIRGLSLAAFNLEMNVFIATSAIIDFGIDFTRSAVYISNGFVHTHDLYLIPILVGIGFIGTYIGKKILGYFSEKQFKLLVLVLVFIVGVITMLKYLLS
ncbi:MAG TPA: sulfite exporter TauE/SafE family protein [Bacteroidia bacterium]